MTDWLHVLEETTLAVAIRQSTWLYPAIEIVHIVGIVLLVGPAFMFDLRLLGVSKQFSIQAAADYLLPWSRRSLWLIIPSGILLFITNAETTGRDPIFITKIILIVVGALNAFVFHKFLLKTAEYNRSRIKIPALISIAVWISVIACGRLIAY